MNEPTRDEEVEGKIPPHKHCKICGRMIPANKDYCSAKCERIDLDRRRSYETYRTWLFITLITMVILSVINIVLLGLGR